MASDKITFKIQLCPDDETMAAILMLLNLWQDANPDHMVAMVPAKDGYEYEIIRKRRAIHDQGSTGGEDPEGKA